jgi:hypothetical protein
MWRLDFCCGTRVFGVPGGSEQQPGLAKIGAGQSDGLADGTKISNDQIDARVRRTSLTRHPLSARATVFDA